MFRNAILIAIILLSNKSFANGDNNITHYNTGINSIWFSLGAEVYGGIPKYSGAFGTYTANHTPMAIRHNNKIFFTYSRVTLQHHEIGIASIDQGTGIKQESLLRLIPPVAGLDPHQNATVTISQTGYIYVFQAARSLEQAEYLLGRVYRSRTPNTLPTANDVFNIDTQQYDPNYYHSMSYIQPWYFDSQQVIIYTNYTNVNGYGFRRPSVKNSCFPAGQNLLTSGAYAISLLDKGRLHLVHNYLMEKDGNPSHADARRNIYYMYSDDYGCTWKNRVGNLLALPIDLANNNTTLIHTSTNSNYGTTNNLQYIYLEDIFINSDNELNILAVNSTSEDPRTGTKMHFVHKIDGSRTFLADSGHNYNVGNFYSVDNVDYVIFPYSNISNYAAGFMAIKKRTHGNNWEYTDCFSDTEHAGWNYSRRIHNSITASLIPNASYVSIASKTETPKSAPVSKVHLQLGRTDTCTSPIR